MEKNVRIYLDWNATAPVLGAVRDAMVCALDGVVGNASSIHHEGQRARSVVERARRAVARAVGAPSQSVVLTGGATEGNNQVLWTHIKNTKDAHVVCSSVEHPSVLEVVEVMGAQGIRVTVVSVDAQGVLRLDELDRALQDGATLVSMMWANNEHGVLHPLSEVRRMTRAYDVLLHVDGTQAFGRIPLDVGVLDMDYMTLSFHKMGGPKGIGAIVVREGLFLESLLFGGHQERGRRPGTENVVAAAGLEAAARLVAEHALEWRDVLEEKRARFLLALEAQGVGFELRGDQEHRLPNTLNIAFDDVQGEDALLALDLEGVSASSGSACTAGSLEPSHVILAMGYDREEAKRSVRLSFGPTTGDDALEEAAQRIGVVVNRLKRMA